MVHLQEDGCVNRYGIVRFTSLIMSSLVGRTVCWILKVTDIPYLYIQYNPLPENKPSGSKHVEDIKN
jgi:hypothetical protein